MLCKDIATVTMIASQETQGTLEHSNAYSLIHILVIWLLLM